MLMVRPDAPPCKQRDNSAGSKRSQKNTTNYPMDTFPHIAIVSLGYPPVPHVSGFRAHGFATELASLGCNVTVVTSDSQVSPATPDTATVADAHDGAVTVIRAPIDESAQWPARRRPSVLYRHFAAGHAFDWVTAGIDLAAPHLPRGSIVWGIHGGSSAHELARRLANSCSGAWIADFKDDWLPPARRGMARIVESQVTKHRLASAAMATAASQLQANDIMNTLHIPTTPIYTGVDIDWWQQSEPRDLGPTFNIVYTGHLTYTMDTEILIDGFGSAKDTFGDDVRIHYFGTQGDRLREALSAAGCLAWYVDHGWVSHLEAARYQRAADLLLYLPLVRSPNVPVKFLEYLASQRPIISVPDERDERFRILRETSPGVDAATTPSELAQFLTMALNEWRNHGRVPDQPRCVSEFAWRPQADRLLAVFRDVAEHHALVNN